MAGYEWSLTSPRQFIDVLFEKGPLPQETMEVYDYEALYPSIKLEPACLMLYRLLLESLPQEETDPVWKRSLCHLLVHEAYFQFRGSFYKQAVGVPIGSPLVGILAELVVQKKESEVFHKLIPTVKFYRRYIDDIIIIRKRNEKDLEIESLFEDQSLGLKLKKVKEDEAEISYLDLKIKIVRGEYQMMVYRKGTYIPVFIHKSSSESWPVKMASFRALINRIFTHL